MKLALKIEDVGNFRRILGFVLGIRKQCIFKFKQDELNVVSIDRDSPFIWGSIAKVNFTRYDVVAKDECIGLEINIEPLYQILKNFEKSPSKSELVIKLQRGEEAVTKDSTNGSTNSGGNTSNGTTTASASKRRPVFLALTYNEDITISTEISHSFSIPVSLLRTQINERIQIPEIHNVELIVDLDRTLAAFFTRIERYKATDSINLVMNRLGELKVELKDDGKRMSLKWKGLLETFQPEAIQAEGTANAKKNTKNDDLEMIKEITVKVKLKWWNVASRLIELCDTLQMYIYEDGCVFNCHVEDEQSCSILYYLPGKLLQ